MTDANVNPEFKQWALETKFSGGDHNNDENGLIAAGSPDNPSIWCFGIEHGTWSPHDKGDGSDSQSQFDDTYSVEQQWQWPYNKKLFKLLAAIHGEDVENSWEFAQKHKPFVHGSPGYFKGNLYPYGFHNVADYTEAAKQEIGLDNKDDYYSWCNAFRIPVIRSWVEEHRPKVFIGSGISNKEQFAACVFDGYVGLKRKTITINGHDKNLFSHVQGWRKLVVVPHFTGVHGLNSDESIRLSGEYIREIMDS